MTRPVRIVACVAAALGLGGCAYGTYEYPAAQYLHRSPTITMSAGNAQEINEATHVIDPWKRGVGDPRIPVNGERMANAAERYRAKSTGGQAGQPGASPVAGTAATAPATSSGSISTTSP
jgi:hypothetical protein